MLHNSAKCNFGKKIKSELFKLNSLTKEKKTKKHLIQF